MGGCLIYLDHAATTPIDPTVLARMDEINNSCFANPSSIHSLGQKSKVLIEQSRKIVADCIGAKAGEIVFTSGGTEANNFAIIGAAKANRVNGNHIITSRIEHPAVLNACHYLAENGFRISYIDLNNKGELDLVQLEQTICSETIIISLMMVNNETGYILPINDVCELIKDRQIIFHSDAIQALDKIDFSVDEIKLDLLSLSSHKIYGPKGCGVLFIRQGALVDSILFGGSQETNRRPGTENITAIAGFAEALKQMGHYQNNRKLIRHLGKLFEKTLKELIPNLKINGENTVRVPGYSNIYFPFMSGESILMNLDLQGISVSTGSACSSGSQKPSHVLQAMGFEKERINNSVRFTIGRDTTKEEILKTIDVLVSIYEMNKNK